MPKSRAFAAKYGQNISSAQGVTKSRTFAAKSYQNISSSVGVTKKELLQQNMVKTFLALKE